MTSILDVDIETYSSVDLPKTGVYPYAESPDFEILMAAWSLDESPTQVAIGYDAISAIPGLRDPDVLKCAHNAQFERICFSRFFNLGTGNYLPPHEWHDTQAIAAEWGYPQHLGALAKALGAEDKDEAGTRLINLFCKPNRKGGRNTAETHPSEWLEFIQYCIQDVDTLRDVRKLLDLAGGWPTDSEREVYLADQNINDRGMYIDSHLARVAVVAGSANAERQTFEMIEASGWQILNPNSNPQMKAWGEAEGLNLPNFQKDTVSAALEGDLTAEQRTVLELRQDLALVAPKKFSSALQSMLPDSRLRGTLKFFGAHTGRWTGKGTQVHNLPREQIGLTPEQAVEVDMLKEDGRSKADLEHWISEAEQDNTDAAIRDLKLGKPVDANTLKALVRAMFEGPLTVVDYSSVEAIVLAWVASEEWVLEAFRAGRDIYVETADRMSTPDHPLDRSQGKVAVLALGYNGAVNSLRAMGAEGDDRQLMVLVKQWRKTNPKICRMWQELGDAFGETGKVGEFLEVTESHDDMGRTVHIWLPSGRAISYHNTKWERYKVKDPVTGRMIDKEGWRYADPRNPFSYNHRIGTYGGRLAENVTQAVARDIMAGALVRLVDAGYPVVAHVHDEIIAEGELDVDAMTEIMTEVPHWAPGLPIGGDGHNFRRYRKG